MPQADAGVGHVEINGCTIEARKWRRSSGATVEHQFGLNRGWIEQRRGRKIRCYGCECAGKTSYHDRCRNSRIRQVQVECRHRILIGSRAATDKIEGPERAA